MNRFALIICHESQWPEGKKKKGCPIIFSLRFPDETEDDFREALDKALKKLPFPTHYWYAIFCEPGEAMKVFREMEVVGVVDSPGAEEVFFQIEYKCKRMFFLPRDPVKGFIDLEKQTQCLSVLRQFCSS